ncbi:MAG: cobalamin biosynthesis protein CobD, partial [Lachnospiraceae bacterium]|nr:cobalamin biosynthesis protein CobD [Lachnospiraceae bacterium]
KEAEPEDIKKACRIMYVAAGLGLVLLVGLRVLLF